MLWAVLLHLVGFVVDLVGRVGRSEDAKDLEIALLRHRLRQESDKGWQGGASSGSVVALAVA